MTYKEKLLDPRWQRKRLEVMNRDQFKCTDCGKETETLHVHHKFYLKGSEPWEYENEILTTLCYKCHENEERSKVEFDEYLKYCLVLGYTYGELASIICALVIDHDMIPKKERTRLTVSCAASKEILNVVKVAVGKRNITELMEKD